MDAKIKAKFDRLVLKPLWLLFIILAIFYFSQASWLIGILMIVMNFLLGMIAASFHKEKTFHELTQGYFTCEEATHEIITEPTQEVYYCLGKSIVRLVFLFLVAALILTFHHGLRWYCAIGLSLLIGWLGPLLWIIPFLFFLWRCREKSRRP